MLGAERLFVAGERALRQFERLAGAPAGDQCISQHATLAIGLRMVDAEPLRRTPKHILAGEDLFCPLVLAIERGLECLSVDDTHRDQIFTDPAAQPFLTRQSKLDVLLANEALRNQQFAKEHDLAPSPMNLEWCTPWKTLRFQANRVN